MKNWNFNTTYITLPSTFYSPSELTPVTKPTLAVVNLALAEQLGVSSDYLQSPAGVAHLAGNTLPAGAASIAQAYAGHQFGHFTMLGDGRAILLGEQITPEGSRVDIQLKGPGPTKYSRRGDGRAALAPMLREYIISEAMHALGIPTTRSLAVIATGEAVMRERPLPGAILTRVAASHIRVGTFEYAANYCSVDELRALADYTIARHYPNLVTQEDRYRQFLRQVINKQAALVRDWMLVGFIHGVMNTDNTAISGETIDYGPCAFMDTYNPATVFSSIDRDGRYSYENQPAIIQWNIARFAESLLPLLHSNPDTAVSLAQNEIERFPNLFRELWTAGMLKKIGIESLRLDDISLLQDLLIRMANAQLDYTFTFRSLSQAATDDSVLPAELSTWRATWLTRLGHEPNTLSEIAAGMNHVNPAIIPRNALVETALNKAELEGDLALFNELLNDLSDPYSDGRESSKLYPVPPKPEKTFRTFCGT